MVNWKGMCKRSLGIVFAVTVAFNSLNITPVVAQENIMEYISETAEDKQLGCSDIFNIMEDNETESDDISETVENNEAENDNDNETDEYIQEQRWDGVTTQDICELNDVRITYTLLYYWQGGYQADVTIENIGERDIDNWCLIMGTDDNISNIWNAEAFAKDNGQIIIKNAGWNQKIPVGGSVNFGFCGGNNFEGFPQTYKLTGEEGEISKEDYSITYIVDSDWGNGFTGTISITNNTDKILESWMLSFDFARNIDRIWNADVESANDGRYVIKNKGYNANIGAGQTISFGFSGNGGSYEDVPIKYVLTSYVNEIEKLEGVDTDGDGLSDYEEMYITYTDPLFIDTDGDDLSDADEINIYGTDPLKPDTDGDGLTDYDDIILGFSPLMKDTDGNGILDGDEVLSQSVEEVFEDDNGRGISKVSVTLSISGNAQKSVHIRNVYKEDTLSRNLVGLVGVPVDINVHAEFDTAELTFQYDESALGDIMEENLAILWYDEEHNFYRILDSVVDTKQNTVSYVTNHFSTYMLVDSSAWYEAWRENIDYRNSVEGDEKHSFDIVFTVDISGSMIGNRIAEAKKALIKFINSMQNEDEGALVCFNHYATVCNEFTNSDIYLKQSINRIKATGGTNVNSGLLAAVNLFKDRESDKQRIIVLICDGDVNYVQSTIDSCVELGIQIYAVNIASSSAHEQLEKMAKLTGGQHYYGITETSIGDMIGFVQNETINAIDSTDTDGDGLYDVYEKAGMKLPNGQVIYTDPEKADTDGDGLTDFEETGMIYQLDDRYSETWIGSGVSYFILRSDPTKADTDDDGIRDDKDEHPWRKETEWVAQLDNVYDGMEYLHVANPSGEVYNGGDQGWWEEKITIKDGEGYEIFRDDEYYRLVNMGCGVIAMNDFEIYMMQQNPGYHSAYPDKDRIEYDSGSGLIGNEAYMKYVERNYNNVYPIPGEPIHYNTGLVPENMETGIMQFMELNGSEFTDAKWAPYSMQMKSTQKKSVIKEIETMLNYNLPVVFSYFSWEKNDNIKMYNSLENAKQKNFVGNSINGHYMTIIGLYKYLNTETSDYEYILKIVSWGDIYYIRYDEYSESLNLFTNILKVS